MKTCTTSLLCVFFIVCFPILGKTQANVGDSLALKALYDATDGDNWTNTWDTLQPVSTWFGVTLDGTGRVTNLFLSENQLNGNIPSELENLTNLINLNLGINQFTGSIPSELGNLTSLESLNLQSNQFTGNIPSELENLTNLQFLYLNTNQLSGNIPTELGNLESLQYLNLGINQLSGNIPEELGSLNNLQNLWLDNNQLSGTIPTELGNLDNLQDLILRVNELNGTIPAELGNLSKLQRLWLHTNELNGTIPVELGNLSNLQDLNLTFNQLNGAIPVEFGNLSKLQELRLFSNQLSGSIPSELGNLTDLTSLFLLNNQLSGCYDANLTNLCTQLTGVSINIGNNFDATWEDFCNNGVGTCISTFNETDSLALVALYNATDGSNWTNSWDLSQPVGTWFGVDVLNNKVVKIQLNNNNLIGKIPPEIGDLNSLVDLWLSNNQLSGSIPSTIGNLTNLSRLWLYDNQLNGNIPPELGSLTNLDELNLRFNQLSGNIPPELGELSNLRFLYCRRNYLSGNIPPELGNLGKLEDMNLAGNELKGEIPLTFGNLSNLKVLNIDDNQLGGIIPNVLTSLTDLDKINVDKNDFSGIIPAFDNLSSLKVEYNKFSHEDIATNYNINSTIDFFTYSPQYYGYEQHQHDTIGQEVTLQPAPPIPYPNASVSWFKDGSPTGIINTTYTISELDSSDVAVYEYRFTDATLAPPVDLNFQSLPVNNYITGLDLENEPIIEDELIFDLTNIPEDEIEEVLALLDSFGELIDQCGCDTPLYLYEFDTIDIQSILDTLGGIRSSKEVADLDGSFNRVQSAPPACLPDNGGYLPQFSDDSYQDDVVIAYLDTGADIMQKVFEGRLWREDASNCSTDRNGDIVNNSGRMSDQHGHGTGVGSLIANNIPPAANIRIMPVKVYGDADNINSHTLFHLSCGVHYAIDNGADLINISMGYKGQKSSIFENALRRARNEGVIVVASAGNDGLDIDEEKYWPAKFAADVFNLPNVLTVAALNVNDNDLWDKSNRGDKTVNFAVRGEDIVVPKSQSCGLLTGTSASAPLATLALARQMAVNKNRGYQTIIDELYDDDKMRTNPKLEVIEGRWLDIEFKKTEKPKSGDDEPPPEPNGIWAIIASAVLALIAFIVALFRRIFSN